MTAVANPPAFPQISQRGWGPVNGSNAMNPDEVRGMFAPRKPLSRSNSSSSISSNSSASSVSTVSSNSTNPNSVALSGPGELNQWNNSAVARKRPQQMNAAIPSKVEIQTDFSRSQLGRSPGFFQNPQSLAMQQAGGPMAAPQGMMRQPLEQLSATQPVLYLLSLNGTFERKTIAVPYAPESLRIGRQTNQKTVPTPANGFFDSKVLSRQHAEIYAERNGKVYIRDVKSSNGTFVNGTRLSQENRESEPHELQTGDHLELGIDIVNEDQKTIMHHKVAAKVEHSGFLSPSNNVLDMNFGDLDPANGSMMVAGGVPFRGRAGSNVAIGANGRIMPNGPGANSHGHGMPHQQRPFFLTPIATDQILKRLTVEVRNARIQAQDLGRTSHFINTLLSKDDVKDQEKVEGGEFPRAMAPVANGNSSPFRSDPKTRFSDPPAPPPQQPLPEKPDMPSLKRGPTERPKSGPPNSSPIRQENLGQIIQLTEALNNAKRDIEMQTARMLELEAMLQHERAAREEAEVLARRFEESKGMHMNGAAKPSMLEIPEHAEQATEINGFSPGDIETSPETPTPNRDDGEEVASALQTRIDTMEGQMHGLQQQMEQWKERCEIAESERDADRKTLAEMVAQLRAEEQRRTSREKTRSRSRRGRASCDAKEPVDDTEEASSPATQEADQDEPAKDQLDGLAPSATTSADPATPPTSATTKQLSAQRRPKAQGQPLEAGMPYASMLGVVLLGMGMMAYLNGWQSSPRLVEH